MTLATSREKLSEAITLAKTRGEDSDLSKALVDAAEALDGGKTGEALVRLDEILTKLTRDNLTLQNRLEDLAGAADLAADDLADAIEG